jgi:hypothetical protein
MVRLSLGAVYASTVMGSLGVLIFGTVQLYREHHDSACALLLMNLDISKGFYAPEFNFCGFNTPTPLHIFAIVWAIPASHLHCDSCCFLLVLPIVDFEYHSCVMTGPNALLRTRQVDKRILCILAQDGTFCFSRYLVHYQLHCGMGRVLASPPALGLFNILMIATAPARTSHHNINADESHSFLTQASLIFCGG